MSRKVVLGCGARGAVNNQQPNQPLQAWLGWEFHYQWLILSSQMTICLKTIGRTALTDEILLQLMKCPCAKLFSNFMSTKIGAL